MIGGSIGCGLCPWSCSGEDGAYELILYTSYYVSCIQESTGFAMNH